MTSKVPGGSSQEQIEFSVPEGGARLDRQIAAELDRRALESGGIAPTRSQISSWIAAGRVAIDGAVTTKPGFRPKPGSHITVVRPLPRSLALEPDREVPFTIVHEEPSFLVVDKPAGVVVHPGAGVTTATLVHGLLHHLGADLPRIGDAFRPGIIHRLDRDTSGLMVVAKTEAAFRSLSRQLRPPRTMGRRYLLVAPRTPRAGKNSRVAADAQSGEIVHPIGRSSANRTKMSVTGERTRTARTFWSVKEAFPEAVLCEAILETGRTHQIRVHFQATGAPLLGDPVYGGRITFRSPAVARVVSQLGRQALHAYVLSFNHPETGSPVRFESPLPADLLHLLAVLRGDG